MMNYQRAVAFPLKLLTVVLLFGFATISSAAAEHGLDEATSAALDNAINGEHRSADNKARDKYRRPKETLAFFGFRSDMTVVEIWPGGGWYTEILAHALKEKGDLYAAQYSPNPPFSYQRRYFGAFLTKTGETPMVYGDVIVTTMDFPYQLEVAPPGSADMVLTFRNAHNWVGRGYSRLAAGLAFQAMYDALQPGGILGVVDHRWPDPDNEDTVSE